MSLHWFFDDIPDDFRDFRRRAAELEQDYLDVRQRLRQAQSELQDAPDREAVQARVNYLQKRQADLERQAPWLTEDMLHEVALWGCPH